MGELFYLVLLLMLIGFFLQVDFMFYILYLLLGLYLFSRWYTPRGLKKLRLRRRFDSHAFLGERVPVNILLENRSRLPLPWMQLHESIPPELRAKQALRRAVTLRGREQLHFEYELNPHKRGYYEIGPLRLTTGDLFGFMEVESHLALDHLTVYPQIIPLTELGFSSRLPFGTLASQQRLFADPTRPSGMRSYQTGDSQRQINWKASAHVNDLMVKTYQPAMSLETAVALDLNRGGYPARGWRDVSEWSIVVAASIAAHLSEKRQAVGLLVNGLDSVNGERPLIHKPRTGRPHLIKMLETLARAELAQTPQPVESWIAKMSHLYSWGTTVVVIAPHGEERLCYALHGLVRQGLNPILIVTTPYLEVSLIQRRARGLGFRAYHIAGRPDLDPWRA